MEAKLHKPTLSEVDIASGTGSTRTATQIVKIGHCIINLRWVLQELPGATASEVDIGGADRAFQIQILHGDRVEMFQALCA